MILEKWNRDMKQIIWATKLQGWCRHSWKMTRLKLQTEKKLEVILFCVCLSLFLSFSFSLLSFVTHLFQVWCKSAQWKLRQLENCELLPENFASLFFFDLVTRAHRRENTRDTLPLVSYLPKLLGNIRMRLCKSPLKIVMVRRSY